jgi:mono/diheme cytochrome c family protein
MGLPEDKRFREANPWIAVSRAYYTMGHAIVARKRAALRGLGELAGKRVAVEGGSIADLYLLDKGIERGIYRSQEEAVRAVTAGEAPAAFLWRPVAAWLARAAPDVEVLAVSDPRLEFPVGVGVRRREPDLAAEVDAAIGRLADSGKVRELLARYGAVDGSPARRESGSPAVAESRDPVEAGRSLFSTACSRCHGAEGVGGGQGGAIPSIRNYEAGQEKFVRVVESGRRATAMAPFKGILTSEEILMIYQYLTALPRQ